MNKENNKNKLYSMSSIMFSAVLLSCAINTQAKYDGLKVNNTLLTRDDNKDNNKKSINSSECKQIHSIFNS